MQSELLIAAAADIEAAIRYRQLAERNPTQRREFLHRADEAEAATPELAICRAVIAWQWQGL